MTIKQLWKRAFQFESCLVFQIGSISVDFQQTRLGVIEVG